MADLAEQMSLHCFTQPDAVSRQVNDLVAELFDYMREYGDIDDLYTFSQKIEVHGHLNDYLVKLKGAGFSVCYTLRHTKIVGKDWVDKAPWPVTIGYVFVTSRGNEPKQVAVHRQLNMGF